MVTTDILIANNVPVDRLYCPQFDEEDFHKMKHYQHVSLETLYNFLQNSEPESIGALWMDYCGTFEGNQDNLCPREDVRLLVEKKLIAPGGVVFITVSLRGLTETDKAGLHESMALAFGRTSYKRFQYHNMYFACYRF
jgi:hypothetical protein